MRRSTTGKLLLLTILPALAFLFSRAAFGMAMEKMPDKKAIVLAGFGTTYPSALVSYTNVLKTVQQAFPGVTVRLAFTSNIIRDIWHKRQQDPHWLSENTDVPKDILYVKGPLAAIADLQDEGCRTIVVQPCNIYAGEEFHDLSSYVRGLDSITTMKAKYKPFVKLVVGRPVLGQPGPDYDYHKDLEVAAKVLAPDIALSAPKGDALVYMGHGDEYFSTGIYAEFEQVLRKTYPDAKIFVGTVEGFPSLDDTVKSISSLKIKKVMLKPLMFVAGDHANNDMAGNGDDSWKNTFKRAGVRTDCILHGLGENQGFDQIYVQHIRDAAKDANIHFQPSPCREKR
jgi:sirohydrochlorin cobaltochelatase